jgi:hypothetical protein
MRQMIGRALRGPEAGGSIEARIVSFADHWERFSGWLDPFSLIDPDVPDVDKDRKPIKPAYLIHIPWELISAISGMAPDIAPSQVLANTPIGWYSLSAGNPETGLATAVLVYDHQKEAFEKFLEDSRKRFPVLTGRGGASVKYFNDIPDPVPSNSQLAMLNAYVHESGKPKYIAFKERDEFDPVMLVKENSMLTAPKLRKKAVDTYQKTLASKLYPTEGGYIEAVFDALGRLMSEQDGPVDEVPTDRKGRSNRPPYKKWSLKKLMLGVIKQEKLRKTPAPVIRWSKRPTKTTWAVYREHDNSIVVNCFLKTDAIANRTMEFLIYHELLHHELGVEEGHSRYFREREREFAGYADAEADLDTLVERIGKPRIITDWA